MSLGKIRNKDGTYRAYKTIERIKKIMAISVFGTIWVVVGVLVYQHNDTLHVLDRAIDTPTLMVGTHKAYAEGDMTREKLEQKIQTLTDEMMDKLLGGESHTSWAEREGDVLYSFDAQDALVAKCRKEHGERDIYCDSWGAYQWKIPSVQYRVEQLRGEEITQIEAMLLALDAKEARALAVECIIKIEGCIADWGAATVGDTQVVKEWYNDRVSLIRELQAIID